MFHLICCMIVVDILLHCLLKRPIVDFKCRVNQSVALKWDALGLQGNISLAYQFPDRNLKTRTNYLMVNYQSRLFGLICKWKVLHGRIIEDSKQSHHIQCYATTYRNSGHCTMKDT